MEIYVFLLLRTTFCYSLLTRYETSSLLACTAEKTDEVEFLDVNHCVTIEDDFGFVTKDFVKPTAEGRQFINGNSHHPHTTFKSILFGEAIRLRRLNQTKDYYLNSLKRLKEKAIPSKFPLNMTNDLEHDNSKFADRFLACTHRGKYILECWRWY